MLHAFLVLAYLGWEKEPEQKAEKEPSMGRPLLIPFSYRIPVTQSFISKLTPHLRKKEGRRRQGPPALSLCVVVVVGLMGEGNTECYWFKRFLITKITEFQKCTHGPGVMSTATCTCLCSETLLLSARIASVLHRCSFSIIFIPTAIVMRETHIAWPIKHPQ